MLLKALLSSFCDCCKALPINNPGACVLAFDTSLPAYDNSALPPTVSRLLLCLTGPGALTPPSQTGQALWCARSGNAKEMWNYAQQPGPKCMRASSPLIFFLPLGRCQVAALQWAAWRAVAQLWELCICVKPLELLSVPPTTSSGHTGGVTLCADVGFGLVHLGFQGHLVHRAGTGMHLCVCKRFSLCSWSRQPHCAS